MSAIRALSRLTVAIGEFRTVYPDVTATTIEVFLVIAANPGISSGDILKKVSGVSQSAISRHIATLGEYNWKGGEGLKLIEAMDDPNDRRIRVSYLTATGKAMAMRLARILDPHGEQPEPSEFPTARERGVRGAR
jgi:DNA-binding MarR family transcriptional regulator